MAYNPFEDLDMSHDHDDHNPADDEDKGPDAIADGSPEIVATSARSITVEMQQEREKYRRAMRDEWKNHPLRAAFKRVVAPSALIGGAAYLLSVAKGEPSWELAALAGAAYYPAHMVSTPVARWAGKISGHVSNMFGTNLYYQQVTKEISYEAFTRGALLALLLTSAVMGPTYVNIAKDATVESAKGISYVAKRAFFGFQNYPDTKIEAAPAAPETKKPEARKEEPAAKVAAPQAQPKL
jgi:hypothetical protein